MPTLAAPLVLPSTYNPHTPGRAATCRCGAPFRHPVMTGRLPLDGPCCAKPKGPKRPRVIHAAPRFTAREIVACLNSPGWASVRTPGSCTVFAHGHAYQADDVVQAVTAALDVGERR
jgi:predicted RNA binding protein YcfA (HicA-like mRNA interferase family)